MYMTQIQLNSTSPAALRTLTDADLMHKYIWSAFPHREQGGPGRILYRVEIRQNRNQAMILIQSEKEPDLQRYRNSEIATDPQTKKINPQFKSGQKYRFRLKANPVQRIGNKGDPHYGKRVSLYKEEQQKQWLHRKAALHGFEVLSHYISGKENNGSKSSRQLSHFTITYDGTLRITDPDQFETTLTSGIGPAKAFGYGLLSIARA